MAKISSFRKFMQQPTLVILCEMWLFTIYFIGLVSFFQKTMIVTIILLTIFSISVLIIYLIDPEDFSEFLSHNSFLDILR